MASTVRYRSGFSHEDSKRTMSQTVKVFKENGLLKTTVVRSIKQNKNNVRTS